MMSMVQVAMPKPVTEQETDFVNKLSAAFQAKVAGFDLSVNFKPNQIVVVCANAGFPLRFLFNMKTLKDRYDRLLAAPQGELNRMVLHTESFAKPLPELFELDVMDL